ncbi:Polyprenyl synthetase [Macrophomina phaseolina MS6]|uniref:Macrophomene synthase n=2 Tax=Macrophomina phaseolina (strain MS6) TaxID=1126212 RepID=MPMS_MACPH|nr:RecName: Full=Macrophomene synthase; Short=MpMS; Includes: RecName: Full=Terpene cyclase; Includes: RecName: Full=Hexaprenyl-diphosphate synthase; Short=HexPP synthase [Macrophomina phaseolina MS6]EKG20455.1 Polyprenyl synthetase [Macrophomina phaseolina MS6]
MCNTKCYNTLAKMTVITEPAMEYMYSVPLDESEYDKCGFCQDPRYRPRRHKDQHLARAGSAKAKELCEALIGVYPRPTCESAVGHSIALVMPECMPGRVEAMGEFMESIFYMDNIAESGSQQDTGNLGTEWANDMETGPTTSVNSNTGAKQVMAKLALQLLSIDPVCAGNVMKAWKEWAAGFAKPRRFDSIEQYIDYRLVDSGAIVAVHLMNFGMGLDISVEELREVSDIVNHAGKALSYQNDFFSFNYEHDMFVKLPDSIGIANAVFVLAETEGLSLAEAKERVKELAKEHEDAVLRLKDEVESKVSYKLRICLEGLVDMVVGNLVWSASCDRYSSYRREKHQMELPIRIQGPPTPPQEPVYEKATLPNGKQLDAPTESSGKDLSDGVATLSGDEPVLGDEIVSAPIKYLESLPSKGFREAIIDGMNGWLNLPARSVSIIKDVVKHIHTASLLCDDIEDSSPLRRGQPSAHIIFGVSQTVNSTSYLWTLAIDRLSELSSPKSLRIFIDEVRKMQIGQSFDLHWTAALQCPSEEEYLSMIDMKTGGLFHLLIRLMIAESPRKVDMDFSGLVSMTGRYFQIRDDLSNLTSEEYENQKGYCEDLDEGKYSLPLIHALKHTKNKVQLESLLIQRKTQGGMTLEMKRLAIQIMKEAGSLEHTRKVVLELQDAVHRELAKLEEAFGQENYVIQLALERLRIKA